MTAVWVTVAVTCSGITLICWAYQESIVDCLDRWIATTGVWIDDLLHRGEDHGPTVDELVSPYVDDAREEDTAYRAGRISLFGPVAAGAFLPPHPDDEPQHFTSADIDWLTYLELTTFNHEDH